MVIDWFNYRVDAAFCEKVLGTIRGTPEFKEWRAEPEKFAAELHMLFSRAGIDSRLWAQFVHDYAGWVAEGKRLAEFAVAFGFPASTDARSVFCMSLATHYAEALHEKRAYFTAKAAAGTLSDAAMKTFGMNEAEVDKYRTEAALAAFLSRN